MNDLETVNKKIKTAIEVNKQLAKGIIVGKVFKISVADGYAWYEIIKTKKDKVTLKLREDLETDDYKDLILGDGGDISKDRIRPIIEWQDKIDDMFN